MPRIRGQLPTAHRLCQRTRRALRLGHVRAGGATVAYLYSPSDHPGIRLGMAFAVLIGFFSHLLLDEICSVDLRGARLNKAFGTALKFWSPSPWATLGVYSLLAYLTWRVIQV